MDSKKTPYRKKIEETRRSEILQQFVSCFSSKGWLNQSIRIQHNDKKYRLMCSEKQFMAFRINDNWGVPPGVPGWIVCVVGQEQILQDSDFSPFNTDEPTAHDWLRHLQKNNY